MPMLRRRRSESRPSSAVVLHATIQRRLWLNQDRHPRDIGTRAHNTRTPPRRGSQQLCLRASSRRRSSLTCRPSLMPTTPARQLPTVAIDRGACTRLHLDQALIAIPEALATPSHRFDSRFPLQSMWRRHHGTGVRKPPQSSQSHRQQSTLDPGGLGLGLGLGLDLAMKAGPWPPLAHDAWAFGTPNIRPSTYGNGPPASPKIENDVAPPLGIAMKVRSERHRPSVRWRLTNCA